MVLGRCGPIHEFQNSNKIKKLYKDPIRCCEPVPLKKCPAEKNNRAFDTIKPEGKQRTVEHVHARFEKLCAAVVRTHNWRTVVLATSSKQPTAQLAFCAQRTSCAKALIF